MIKNNENKVVINVEGKNFSFSPNSIKVKKGDIVTINFKSVGGFHDFVIDDFNVATKQVQTGEESSVTFIADKDGDFEFYCSVGKHREMGMVGTLVVEDNDTMMEGNNEKEKIEEESVMKESAGTYEDYSADKLALADSGKVVLFFKASWCPSCNALNKDVEAHLSEIPVGAHILKVDYDNSTEIKKKYGITYQHTFVQVDAQGNQITKWAGSPTLKELVSNIK